MPDCHWIESDIPSPPDFFLLSADSVHPQTAGKQGDFRMSFPKTVWLNDRMQRAGLIARLTREKLATYGFYQVPEDEKVQYVCRHFNSVADNYDLMNTILSFGIHYAWKRAAVRSLDLKPGDKVLDVCGGTGDLAILASRRVGETGEVILYDINRDMILAGKTQDNHVAVRKRIRYIQGDIEAMSFPDNSVDAVMVGFGIRNVTHMEKGFTELHRVLKPGGRLMCLEFSKPVCPVFRWIYDVYSFFIMPWLGQLIAGSRSAYIHLPETIRLFPLPDELAEMLETIGFTDISFTRLTNGIAVIHTGVKQ
jgi:demethylmenaquinone methyltransferase/2-methoxy-6-polyprenyl-1,4-benzoquinol methylase